MSDVTRGQLTRLFDAIEGAINRDEKGDALAMISNAREVAAVGGFEVEEEERQWDKIYFDMVLLLAERVRSRQPEGVAHMAADYANAAMRERGRRAEKGKAKPQM
jgi:hypothetical protein